MRSTFLTLTLLIVLTERGAAADEANFWPLRLPDVPTAIAILQKSEDHRKLEQACLSLARADDPKALPRLGEYLNDPAFWLRLDDPEKIRNGNGTLRLGRVLEAVARKGGAAADDILLKLSENEKFMGNSTLAYPLIDALGYLTNPSEKIFRFLEANRNDRFAPHITQSLLRIGSPEALSVIEKRLRSDMFPPSYQGRLCYRCLPPARTQPNVVALFGRLLRKDGDDVFRDRVVQSLFDYRPDKWFHMEEIGYPAPPSWWHASPDTLRELLKLADLSLELKIEDNTRAAVRKAHKEIEEALAAKTEKK